MMKNAFLFLEEVSLKSMPLDRLTLRYLRANGAYGALL